MTRLFTTGAEEADVRAVWDYPYVAANTTTSANRDVGEPTFGYNEYINWQPRTGRGMYIMNANQYLRNSFGDDTSKTELYFGFAVRPNLAGLGYNPFVVYTDDPDTWSAYLFLRFTAGGVVQLYRSSSTLLQQSVAGVLVAGSWHYMEVWVKPRNANGRFTVKVDGVTVIDYTGDTTSDKEYINGYQFSAEDNDEFTSWDDIVVNDVDGAYNNSWPGMVRLMPIQAHEVGTHSDWTRAGVDLGYDAAQLLQGKFEFSMLQTANADDKHTFAPEIPDLPAGAAIQNIILSPRARVQAGAGVIAPMIISNGTEDISPDQTLLSNWKHYQYAWPINPDDAAAWDEADLALLEIGFSS